MPFLVPARLSQFTLVAGLLVLSAGMAQSPSVSINLALDEADAAREKGQLAAAQAAYRKLLLPDSARSSEQTMRALAGLTATLMDSGDYAEAEAVARQTLDYEGNKTKPGVWRAFALNNLGTAQVSLGKSEEGERTLREAIRAATEILGDDHFEVLRIWSNLAQSLAYRGEYARAVPVLKRVLARSNAERDRDLGQLAKDHHNLGAAHLLLGEFSHAEPHLRKAEELSLSAWGKGNVYRLETLGSLALLHIYRHEFEQAAGILRQAMDEGRTLPREHPMIVLLQGHQASLLARQGHLSDALILQQDVIRKQMKLYPANHRILIGSVELYGKMLASNKDKRSQARVQRWAKLLKSYPGGRMFSPKCPTGSDCCDYYSRVKARG